MTEIDFGEFWHETERRARDLGFLTPEMTERMRNKIGSGTPAKRELLRRFDRRARDAGVEPLKACY